MDLQEALSTEFIDADLPPRADMLVVLSIRIDEAGLGVAWESGDRRGLMAGPPSEVARAVGALVLRLTGCDAEPEDLDDTRPIRPSTR